MKKPDLHPCNKWLSLRTISLRNLNVQIKLLCAGNKVTSKYGLMVDRPNEAKKALFRPLSRFLGGGGGGGGEEVGAKNRNFYKLHLNRSNYVKSGGLENN